jgi:transcriptional regulator with XRE-family HTH domain
VEQPQTLGEHLKRARQLKGIRQKDAARILGVGHFTYMTWEKDQKVPFARYYPTIVAFVGYDALPAPVTEGERLKRERWLLGLTSQEMADRLGIDQGTLLRRESVNALPSVNR